MKNNAGVLPGVFSCLFGVIGILSFGFIFIPLAVVTALFSTVLSVTNLSIRGIGVSLLAWALALIGLFTSPVLLGAIGIALLAPENVKQEPTINNVEPETQRIVNDSSNKSTADFGSKEQQNISVKYANNNPNDEIISVSGLSEKYDMCGDYEFSGAVVKVEPSKDSTLVTVENNLGFREVLQIDDESIKQIKGDIKKLLSLGTNLSTTGQLCGSGGFYYVGSIKKDIKSIYTKTVIDYRTIEDMIFDADNAIGKAIQLNGRFNNFSLANGLPVIEVYADTDTNLKFWRISFSDGFKKWARSLRKEQEVNVVCEVASIRAPFAECKLVRMHYD